jgi:hypothetical protein
VKREWSRWCRAGDGKEKESALGSRTKVIGVRSCEVPLVLTDFPRCAQSRFRESCGTRAGADHAVEQVRAKVRAFSHNVDALRPLRDAANVIVQFALRTMTLPAEYPAPNEQMTP